MLKTGKFRYIGFAVAILATASMVTTPSYAGARGKRVTFRTHQAVLEMVRTQNPGLYTRLQAYRTGAGVTVTRKERAYLEALNRAYVVKKVRVSETRQEPSATEFSSQSRKAREAYAQAAPLAVTVTPKAAAKPAEAAKPVWQQWLELIGLAAPLVGGPWGAFVSAAVIVIQLIIAAVVAVTKAWAGISALKLP